MRPFRTISIVIAVILLFVIGCNDETRVTPTQPTIPAVNTSVTAIESGSSGENRTPFQQSIVNAIAERDAQGLPVPANVTYEYTSPSDAPLSVVLQGLAPGQEVTVVATSTIEYENPAQAGLDEWPDIVVDNNMLPGSFDRGFIHEGNYTQSAMDQLAIAHSGIWDAEDFRQQSRRYIYTETITINCPDFTAAIQGSGSEYEPTGTYVDELLMGFTESGPGIDYSITANIDVWFFGWHDLLDFWAGFKLDWTIGMRLPMEPSLTAGEPLLEGSTYFPTSLVQGLDWSAQDYVDAGVSPEGGNEYVLYFIFKFGVFVEVLGVDVVNIGIDESRDDRSSFVTPFGPGSYFSLSSLDIPLWVFDIGIASGGVGLQLTPRLGSSQFTADWDVSGAASGSGSLTYTNPTSPVSLGPVTAIDGPGQADVLMDSFKYYFNQFLLDLALFFELDVVVLGYNRWSLPITDIDMSVFMGSLHTGTHLGTPSSTMNTLAVQNVAPTAMIDRTGTIMLNGIPTFLANKGGLSVFSGRSTDPGYDDLTLSWDWGDGSPAPNGTTYPVPYDVTDSKSHTFGEACVYTVSFTSVDSDGAMAQDQVPIIVAGEYGNLALKKGYWEYYLNGVDHAALGTATLECYLEIIGLMSTVFNEITDASTIAAAYDVLILIRDSCTKIEQLDRNLLVAWLNYANGAHGYNGLVDIDDDGLADGTFIQLIAAAEMVRLDPNATKEEIREQTIITEHLIPIYTGERTLTSKDRFNHEPGM